MTLKITFLCKTKPKIGFYNMQFGAFTSGCWRQYPFKCQPYPTHWGLVYTAFAYHSSLILRYFIKHYFLLFYLTQRFNRECERERHRHFHKCQPKHIILFTNTSLPLYIQFYFASNILPDITIRWLSTSSEVHKYILITKRYRNYERLKTSSSK